MTSCGRNDKSNQFLKANDFVTEAGIYYYKDSKIVVKEFKDGSLVYGVFDKRNNIIYQQSIIESFSNSKWLIYIDLADNIWFYTSDLQLTSVLLKENGDGIDYNYKKITNDSIKIPEEMKSKINSYD